MSVVTVQPRRWRVGAKRQLMLAAAGAVAAVSLVEATTRRGWWSAVPLVIAAVIVGVVLTAWDLAEHRLPNRWTLGSLPWLLAALAVMSYAEARPGAMVIAIVGGLGSGLFHLVLALAAPTGLGLGDVKLSLGLGALLGWWSLPTLLAGVFLAFVIGGLAALVLVLIRRATRHTHLAFGPAMLIGAWWALLLG